MKPTHLKDLIIVEGMAVDEADEEKINVTIQTLNVSVSSTGGEAPTGNTTINSSAKGETIVDAVSNLSKKLSRKLFCGQDKLIIFSREIAENSFGKNLDYFLRSTNSRADIAVCVSDDKASEIIESKEQDSKVPCETIVNLLNNGQNFGLSAYVTTSELLNLYSDKTSDAYLPMVKYNEKEECVVTNGIAVFDNDRLSYVLDDEETLGFLMISNKIKSCMLEFDSGKLGKVGITISKLKSKNKVNIVNGNVNFESKVDFQLMIEEIEKGAVTTVDDKDLDEICKKAENEIQKLCKKAFNACREHNSDCLRVGEYLAKASPKSYELLSDEWEHYFKNVDYSVSSNADLKKISDNTQVE